MNKKRILYLLSFLLLCSVLAGCAQAETALYLPQSLTAIEDGAFQGDTSIRRVILPDGAQSIGSMAFAASGLNEINLPDSLSHIAPDAFDGCGHIEAHASGNAGKAWITDLATLGCDISWADQILCEVGEYDLRAAKEQTIRRVFTAPETGRYTFCAEGSSAVSIIRYDRNGSQIAEKNGRLSFNLAEGEGALLGFRFADSASSGGFSLSVSYAVNPMAALIYTPSLWVYKDDKPIRDANMNGSLAQLAIGEVLTPTLTISNSDKHRVSGQVTAKLDGETIDLGFFALGALESCTIHVPAAASFAAETAGSHAIEYFVKLTEAESAASMTWNIQDERPEPAYAAIVKAGTNTVELSAADGNLFKFTPTKSGVYKIYTSNDNFDTYAALRSSTTGEIIASDDDSGSPYQNFIFSHTLKANTPVYIDMGMKNFKGATDVTLNITHCGTPSLKYSTSLYVFDGYSWADADNGNLNGTGMIKLKGKADLSTLTLEEYLTPVLTITNSAGKAMPLGLTAVLDGETIYWSGDCEITANGKFVAYLYSTSGRMYETPGTHTIDYYVNGNLATSYTWEVTGSRAVPSYTVDYPMTLGEHYATLNDTTGTIRAFKAPYSGIYRFYSVCRLWDACGFLFDENMNLLAYNDDYGGSEDFSIFRYLEAGQLVFLQGMIFEDMSDTAKLGVEFVSTEPTPALALSLGETPMPMNANDIFTASFTAPYTGKYRICATDPKYLRSINADLYDTYWQPRTVISNGIGGSEHFNILCQLGEGETVYLKATCSKSDPNSVLKIILISQ